ncbi:MAG: hypothetical protein IJ862_03025 [Selenomonadaceae bacterium]|nr:hypothetical protein [Selenomonadaceae bacterium]
MLIYIILNNEEEYNDLTEKQKAVIEREIKVSLYDNLYVNLKIFENVNNYTYKGE